MTGSGAARIARSDLVLGAELGTGGQGKVWAVEKRLINQTWPVAYKEYKPEAQRQLQTAALERMVTFLPGRQAPVGEWLAQNTAWPAALVTEGSTVRGFLMRQIPDEFFMTVPSGDRKPAGFEFLLNPLEFVDKTVGKLTPRQVFGLLLALADTLERLHRMGVVAGDLSPKNLLFSLSGPLPGCFLIDCDAMGLDDEWVLKPVQTPGWKLPDGEVPETPQGDSYKFALLAVRLFLHEQHGQNPAALRRMDTTVGDLAERGLSRTPSTRPTLAEWLDPLRRAFDSAPLIWPTAPQGAPGATTSGGRTTASSTAGGPTAPPTPGPGTGGGTTGGTRSGGARPGATQPPTGPGGGRRTTVGGPVPSYTPPSTPARATPQRAPSSGSKSSVAGWIVLVLLALLGWQIWPHLDIGGGTGEARSETADTREEQAAALNTILAQNAGRRSGVADAVKAMMSCDDLQQDRQVFEDAADARAGLVEKLDELALDQLPDDLAADLRIAWRRSETADRAYARVVDDVSGNCATVKVTGSSAWQDAATASADATAAKKDFVAVWNPMARELGLTTLSWSDL